MKSPAAVLPLTCLCVWLYNKPNHRDCPYIKSLVCLETEGRNISLRACPENDFPVLSILLCHTTTNKLWTISVNLQLFLSSSDKSCLQHWMKKLVNADTPAPYPVLSEHYRNSRYFPQASCRKTSASCSPVHSSPHTTQTQFMSETGKLQGLLELALGRAAPALCFLTGSCLTSTRLRAQAERILLYPKTKHPGQEVKASPFRAFGSANKANSLTASAALLHQSPDP